MQNESSFLLVVNRFFFLRSLGNHDNDGDDRERHKFEKLSDNENSRFKCFSCASFISINFVAGFVLSTALNDLFLSLCAPPEQLTRSDDSCF